MDYIISDLHFGHKNIITYCDRPFKSVKEMDATMIKNWNKVVKGDDSVYILGDFALGSKEYVANIVKQLKGKKYLILGNHDNHSLKWYYEVGFDKVYDKPIIYSDFFIMSHIPRAYVDKKGLYGYFYGHIHDSEEYKDYTANTFCVCAERLNYTPILISEAIKLMRTCGYKKEWDTDKALELI